MPKISHSHEQHRRAQILAAATACFARQGYHATSMDDVVRESGLSVGAIYTYFPSKEDLFLALCEQRAQQTVAALDGILGAPGPLASRGRQAVDYFFDLLANDLEPLGRLNAEFLSEAAKSERIKARQDQHTDAVRGSLRRLLAAAQCQGHLRPDVEIEPAAELLLGLSEGIRLLYVAGQLHVPLARLKSAYLAFVNTGLSTPDAPLFAPDAAGAEVARHGTPSPGDL